MINVKKNKKAVINGHLPSSLKKENLISWNGVASCQSWMFSTIDRYFSRMKTVIMSEYGAVKGFLVLAVFLGV